MIYLKLIGTYKIFFNKLNITSEFPLKARALIAYLCTSEKDLFDRRNLSNMLWGDIDQTYSYRNLRYCLWQTRKILKKYNNDIEIITEGKRNIYIKKNNLKCDIEEWNNTIKIIEWSNLEKSYSDLKKISNLYRGDFLENFYIEYSIEFNDWTLLERERIQKQFLKIQLHLSEFYYKNKKISLAIEELEKIIQIDPYNETVYLKIMKYQYNSGNKSAMVHTYRNLKNLLSEDLNINPNKKLEELYQLAIKNDSKNKKYESEKNTIIYNNIKDNKSRVKIFFYNAQNSKNTNKYYTLFTNSKNTNTLNIDICRIAGKRINYEGIFEILQELEIYFLNQTNNSNREFFIEFYNKVKNITTPDYYLFSNFLSLLEKIKSRIEIRVWNFHYLDEKTIDFFSFLYRNYKPNNIELHIVVLFDRLDPYKRSFIEIFENQNNTKWIEK